MKTIFTTTALLMGLLAAGQSWGAYGNYTKKEVQALLESAVEIKPNNPGLAARLKGLAAKEQGISEANVHEDSAQQQADADLLKEGANAVRVSRPDLATRLDKLAAREAHEYAPSRRRATPGSLGY